jgi:hypothetical protein
MKLSTPKQNKLNKANNPLALSKYYAGFSPIFVQDAIKALNITSKHVVLDPWAGQGTTGWVTQIIGIDSILIDLNPIMSIYSCAADLKQSTNTNKRDLLTNLEHFLPITTFKTLPHCTPPDWAPNRLWNISHSVISHLLKEGLFTKGNELNNSLGVISTAVFLLLIRSIRIKPTTNPTHFKIHSFQSDHKGTKYDYRKMLLRQVVSLLERKLKYAKSETFGTLKVYNADSKLLPLENDSIDFVITSPPYCTRIDYAKLTMIELGLLESCGLASVDQIRMAQMGSPAVYAKMPLIENEWGKTCKSSLSFIYNHDSHGSRNYYYKIFLKYFSDAYASLSEIRRCLKPSGEGLLVVQNSYYKEIEIQLSKIYQEMFSHLGFKSKIVSRNIIKNVLAYRNGKSNKYSNSTRVYREDVIHFRKGKI